jgi:hypothetical protein
MSKMNGGACQQHASATHSGMPKPSNPTEPLALDTRVQLDSSRYFA